jgi:hypothetical protein
VAGRPVALYGKTIESYCRTLIEAMKKSETETILKKTVEFYDSLTQEWIKKGRSKYGVKDSKEFTELLIMRLREMDGGKTRIANKELLYDDERESGVLINVVYCKKGWYAFIKPKTGDENLYFDNRNYNGDVKHLNVGMSATFVRRKRFIKDVERVYADDVRI